jgi:acyl-CoA synthetase (NDP forming)
MTTPIAARRGAPGPPRPRLRDLLDAVSVAVVGASEDSAKVGYRPVRYLLDHGYRGRILPVNPRLDRCQGLPCAATLSDLDEPPDVVVVVVRAQLVPGVLEEAARLGVRGAVVISSGFGESGEAGAELEREVAAIARRHSMAVCGPNSVGIVHTPARLTLTFTEGLVRGELREGRIGMVSQSGAFGTVIFAQAQARGLGLRTYVSSGNETVLGFADYLEDLVADPGVSVIGGYLEGLRDGQRFLEAAATAREHEKPVVLMKVGTTEHGGRAAISHTGMLAGDDRAYDAAMRRAGVVRVSDERELLDVLCAFDTLAERPRGGRVAVVSMSGGAGVLLTDLVSRSGLSMAELSPATRAALEELLPAFASARNPIDLTGQFVTNSEGLTDVLGIVRGDPGVDAVIVFTGLGWAERANWVDALLQAGGDAPLLCIYPLCGPEQRERLHRGGIPVYEGSVEAVRALRAVVRWTAWTPPERPAPLVVAPAARVGTLTEAAAKELVAGAGLAVPGGRVVRSAQQADAAARELGGRLVLKASSSALAHKTEVGGVLLDVQAGDAAAAFERVRAAVAARRPDRPAPDVLVERMVEGELECVIGAVRTPPFGHLVMVGVGGIHVETMGDVAFGLAPVSAGDARAMIESLRAYPVLCGARGGPPLDVDALAAAVSTVSRLAADLGESLEELDLNPVCLRANDGGAVVLDALVRFR